MHLEVSQQHGTSSAIWTTVVSKNCSEVDNAPKKAKLYSIENKLHSNTTKSSRYSLLLQSWLQRKENRF